ncbi:hypothetical protein SDC9_85340 [bioreactor metagenome]|uniref:Uncharacterized protein n=1 Tax=bioreactor metagenome TaxID=1076179 RepID=A0A644ZCW7_9ZZZZ
MTARVFVKQRVVKQYSHFSYRGIILNKRKLSEIGRSFINGNCVFKDLLAFFGVRLNNFTVLDHEIKVPDHVSVYAKRHGGINNAVYSVAYRRGKYFLSRNIGDKRNLFFS